MTSAPALDHFEAALAVTAGSDDANLERKISSSSKESPSEKHHVTTTDGEIPTDEELNTLRRVAETVPWTAWTIAFVELAERFSYYGCTQVFTNFIQHARPGDPVHRTGAALGLDQASGALGMGQRASTGITTFNSFWVYFTPLFGAWVADALIGRFKSICVAVAIVLVGHVMLTGSAAPDLLDNSHGALALFIISVIVIGLGTGLFKPNISILIAEQTKYKVPTVITTKKGERVIVDPAMTLQRFFLWFYLMINVGALAGQIGMVYAEKNVGFWLAFLLPTVIFALCIPVLALCGKWYVKTPPQGSILTKSLRYIGFASKGRWSLNPVATTKNLLAADFWEKSKPSQLAARGESVPQWMTFDDVFVDELRRAFKACQVFAFYPAYWLCYNQINNNLTSQAATMTLGGVPNDLISNLDPIFLVIFIPIMDFAIYPGLRKMGINFSPIKRIFAGFITAALAMVWATVVQHYIYNTQPCGYYANDCADTTPSTLNVWIQSGSYVLIALSEIFASITGLEYAFSKAPKGMKSMVMAVFLFQSAISYALGEAFLALADDPLLVWNYGVFAVASFVFGILFWICFRKLDAEEDQLNLIGARAEITTGGENMLEHPSV